MTKWAEEGKVHGSSMASHGLLRKGEKRLACCFCIWYAACSMKIIVLGSGTSTGVPMVGCTCPVCRSEDPRDRRTRASIMVCHAGKHILVDSSTDLRVQMLRESVPRIDAVLYTHSHADHVNGIDDLRGFHFMHKEVIPCHACTPALDRLERDFGYIFDRTGTATHPALLEACPINGPFDLFGLQMIPVPLQHGSGSACGYRVGSFAYLTDCSAIPAASYTLLEGVSTILIDGLRWSEHPFHFNISGAIEAVKPLQPQRTILTHLTHEVRHTDQDRLPSGVEFAYDGMVIEL